MTLDLRAALLVLSSRRPLFHSEADFQHALAWAIHEQSPETKVRLEYRLPWDGPRAHIDVWLVSGDETVSIELKYWKRLLDVEVFGERFMLANQAAQDLSRYDFVSDLERTEHAIRSGLASRGFVVALTNDQSYWQPGRPGTVDAAFRLTEGRTLDGSMAWAAHASAGTVRGRERPLELQGRYQCRWQPYSNVGGRAGDFRSLVLEVRRP